MPQDGFVERDDLLFGAMMNARTQVPDQADEDC
jgi:hypothetical protein